MYLKKLISLLLILEGLLFLTGNDPPNGHPICSNCSLNYVALMV